MTATRAVVATVCVASAILLLLTSWNNNKAPVVAPQASQPHSASDVEAPPPPGDLVPSLSSPLDEMTDVGVRERQRTAETNGRPKTPAAVTTGGGNDARHSSVVVTPNGVLHNDSRPSRILHETQCVRHRAPDMPLVALDPANREKDMRSLYETFTNFSKSTPAYGRGLKIIYGVLTSPETFVSRCLPLVQHSLRDERSLLLMGQAGSDGAAANLSAFIAKQSAAPSSRTLAATVVPLPPIANMNQSLRNAWLDLPGLVRMYEEDRSADWYVIIDDDTYVLASNMRTLLSEYEDRMQEPLYVGHAVMAGVSGTQRPAGIRGGKIVAKQSVKRDRIAYILGGGGIALNNALVTRLMPYLPACMVKHLHAGGDMRLGQCLNTAGFLTVHSRQEMLFDTPMRHIGECFMPSKFPVSFHRMRRADWFPVLGGVVARKASRWDTVTWLDIFEAFPMSAKYPRSLFYPVDYRNVSIMYGLKQMRVFTVNGKRVYPPIGRPFFQACGYENCFNRLVQKLGHVDSSPAFLDGPLETIAPLRADRGRPGRRR